MLRSSSLSTGRLSARRILSSTSTTSTTSITPRCVANALAARSTLQGRAPPTPWESGRRDHQQLRCLSSSFAEPGTLFDGDTPAADAATDVFDKDAPLRADIRAMGALLGRIVKDHHGKEIFERIEELRALSKEWRTAGAGRGSAEDAAKAAAAFEDLTNACSGLTNEEIFVIARAFNFFLSIANAAEGHHRIRRLNMATREEALPDRYDSW